MSGDPWTNERIDQMKALRSEGISWGDVAKRMGFTKNKVLGKANRLGLLQEKPPPLQREPSWSFPPNGRCVFPIGHLGEDGFGFCGDAVAGPSLPYCQSHFAVAYVPAAKKTDALKQINFAASNLGMKGR